MPRRAMRLADRAGEVEARGSEERCEPGGRKTDLRGIQRTSPVDDHQQTPVRDGNEQVRHAGQDRISQSVDGQPQTDIRRRETAPGVAAVGGRGR